MTTIEVKTQRIIVDPPSGRIEVHGYGTQGPPGPTGPPGPAGPIGWPLVAPATVDGYITFTPSNSQLQGLRPSTDANSWIRFWQGPPNAIYIKSNSGPLTSGRMGEIYLDGDAVFIRSSDAATALASFVKGTGATIPGTTQLATLNVSGNTRVSGSVGSASAFYFMESGDDTGHFWSSDGVFHARANGVNVGRWQSNGVVMVAGNIYFPQNSNYGIFDDTGVAWFKPRDPSGNVHIKARSTNGMYHDADTHYFRQENGTGMFYISSGGIYLYGTRAYRFSDYGGGLWMQDTTWIRTDKAIYMGGNTLGSDGHATFGYGGATDGSWPYRFNGNLWVNQTVKGNNGLDSGRISAGDWWSTSVICNPATYAAGITFHPGGVAPQFRVGNGDNRIHARDSGGNSPVDMTGGAYTNVSTRRSKKNIRDWPGVSLSSAVATPLSQVRKMRPVTFQRLDSNLEQIPSGRRLEAYLRLAKYKQEKGYDRYNLPPHVCSDDTCGRSPENPCGRILNYEKGYLGLVAEEIFELLPVAVSFDMEGQPDGIDYAAMTTALIACVQELADRIELLESNRHLRGVA